MVNFLLRFLGGGVGWLRVNNFVLLFPHFILCMCFPIYYFFSFLLLRGTTGLVPKMDYNYTIMMI